MRHAYGRQITLPEISAQANLSPYHFLRVHKLAYGETPHEFLTRGSHNVTEACFEVGFSSLGSFSMLFSRQVGISPSEYRRHVRSVVAVPRTVRLVFVPSCFCAMLCGDPGAG